MPDTQIGTIDPDNTRQEFQDILKKEKKLTHILRTDFTERVLSYEASIKGINNETKASLDKILNELSNTHYFDKYKNPKQETLSYLLGNTEIQK